jgi:diaminopimelate epimerase
LSLPSVERVTQPAIPLVAGERALGQTVAGVDHLIVLVDDVNAVPMATRGPQLRAHPALGPAGANVNFVSQGAEGWAMRTWERGVEGETLACGTGAVASGAFLASRGDAVLPWTVRSRSRAELTVGGTPSSGGPAILADPTLAGEGRLVYRASLEQAIGSPDVATMG